MKKKKSTFLVFIILIILICSLLFISLFFGKINYMKENKYDYNFFTGDYLYKTNEHNISLSCEAASPFFFRISCGIEDKVFIDYSEKILIENLNAYYIFEKDTIYPKAKIIYNTNTIIESPNSIKSNDINIIQSNERPLYWVELEIPNYFKEQKFQFNLDLTANDKTTKEKINISKEFIIEYGTKFGYRGFPLIMP